MPKKISVNMSTLVDLKAELFRKQEQANRQKQEKKNDNASSSTAMYVKGTKLPFLEARKAAEEKEKLRRKGQSAEQRRKTEQQEAAVREEERQLAKSKERLEAKAKLYEKLQSGQEDGSSELDSALYLVNFEQKSYYERRQNETDSDDDTEIPSTSRQDDKDDGDWVEYTDVLGRTRKCLREDLPNFVAADQKLKTRGESGREDERSWSRDDAVEVTDKSQLLSDDMRRDLKRKEWEREEEEAANRPRGPIHFQHLAQGESRELGVGYYAFATDEQTRQEQMKMLDDLRQQTLSQRERTQKLKEKRQAKMKARLEKVKERKKMKLDDDAGQFTDESDEDVPVTNLDDIPLPPSTNPGTSETSKVQEISSVSAKGHLRPWDVGKPRVAQECWVDKQRGERPGEFAPPSFY